MYVWQESLVHRKCTSHRSAVNWWCSLEVATALLAAEEVDEPVTCFSAVSHHLLNMTHP